jgi:hypothetical protein
MITAIPPRPSCLLEVDYTPKASLTSISASTVSSIQLVQYFNFMAATGQPEDEIYIPMFKITFFHTAPDKIPNKKHLQIYFDTLKIVH